MILHICTPEKFIQPFIEFIDSNFDGKNHHYNIIARQSNKYGIAQHANVNFIDKIIKIPFLLWSMYRADKIILHGLWSPRVNQLLIANPWLLKKCYWVMWGGDFYSPDEQSWYTKQVIKRVGNLVTYIKDDYVLAQQWYGAQGNYYECFMYPSNLYKEYDIKQKKHSTINIQVGNSADPTNNHLEVFDKLEKYKDEDIKIIVPLSYGNQDYAKEVIEQGKKIFGDKFEPLTEFMPFDKYLDLLVEVDIAIFNHNRQQAMGNIITLLGLGKKVYIRNDLTSWNMFKDVGVDVFDVANVSIVLLEEDTKRENQKRVKEYFSEENYLRQLNKLFES